MATLFLRLAPFLLSPAHAANAFVLNGPNVTIPQFWGSIVALGAKWIVPFATTLFLAGAFMMIINANKQERAKQGKTIMTNAILGLVIVLLSYAIIKTVFSIIFPNS